MIKSSTEKIFEYEGKQFLDRPIISHEEMIADAVRKCLDLMYRASYPSITFEAYEDQHRVLPEGERRNARLYEAHYLPQKAYDTIKDDFVEAYEFASPLPTIIEILKSYFKDPVVDKWIEGEDENDPGHRGYENPEPMDDETYKVVEKYLGMANGFFNWNRDLSKFYFNVSNYSPCSDRETVEKWWHEHGDPDFKLPPDEYWTDVWEEEPEDRPDIEVPDDEKPF